MMTGYKVTYGRRWAVGLAALSLFFCVLSAQAAGLYPSVFLRGAFNSWGATAMSDVSSGAGTQWQLKNVRLCGAGSQEFKFDIYGNWSVVWGAPGSWYRLDPSDYMYLYVYANETKNVEIAEAGIYTVDLNTGSPSSPAMVHVAKTANCEAAVYLRGTFNAWGLLPMTPAAVGSSDYQAEISVGTGTQEIKFDYSTNWAEPYGDKTPRDQIGDRGGPNIPLASGNGNYKITWSRSTKRYSIQKLASGCVSSKMYLMSSAYNFGVNPSTGTGTGAEKEVSSPMACVNGLWEVKNVVLAGKGSVHQAGSYKFANSLSYTKNWGLGSKPWIAKEQGNNVVIPDGQQGKYTFRFNEKTLAFSAVRQASKCDGPRMMLMTSGGSVEGYQYLSCVGSNQWAGIVMYTARYGARWVISNLPGVGYENYYGDAAPADGVLEPGGPEGIERAPGRYLIFVDAVSRKYNLRLISRACENRTMYLRSMDRNWINPLPMECENGHWAVEPHFASASGIFFDVETDGQNAWIDIYGDAEAPAPYNNNPNDLRGTADFYKPFINVLGGDYRIHFYDRQDEGRKYRICRNDAVKLCVN